MGLRWASAEEQRRLSKSDSELGQVPGTAVHTSRLTPCPWSTGSTQGHPSVELLHDDGVWRMEGLCGSPCKKN